VVGVVGYYLGPDESHAKGFGDRRINAFALPYLERAEREGLLSICLPLVEPRAVGPYLNLLEGVILTGGEDVGPENYGHDEHPELGRVVPERDAFELALAREAIARRIPVLAICRGIQVLNVAMGGTLVQHLEPGNDLRHWPEDIYISPNSHGVDILDPDLCELVGSDRADVNSYHHQAVLEPGPALRVGARAGGVIESIVGTNGPVLGVQWHPEMMDVANPAATAPFVWFAREVNARLTAPGWIATPARTPGRPPSP
jgi:putative glutamine amidotransferase